jgi:lipooligosaccharide transport system permease protein
VLVTSTLYLAVIAAFGAVESLWALLVPLVAVFVGTAFSAPVAAFAASVSTDAMFPTLFRFGIVPMFLFSGAFFPVERLPLALEALAYATPIWHGVELCRSLTLGDLHAGAAAGHVAYLLAWTLGGLVLARIAYNRRLLG